MLPCGLRTHHTRRTTRPSKPSAGCARCGAGASPPLRWGSSTVCLTPSSTRGARSATGRDVWRGPCRQRRSLPTAPTCPTTSSTVHAATESLHGAPLGVLPAPCTPCHLARPRAQLPCCAARCMGRHIRHRVLCRRIANGVAGGYRPVAARGGAGAPSLAVPWRFCQLSDWGGEAIGWVGHRLGGPWARWAMTPAARWRVRTP